jgi:hypothetical protein
MSILGDIMDRVKGKQVPLLSLTVSKGYTSVTIDQGMAMTVRGDEVVGLECMEFLFPEDGVAPPLLEDGHYTENGESVLVGIHGPYKVVARWERKDGYTSALILWTLISAKGGAGYYARDRILRRYFNGN